MLVDDEGITSMSLIVCRGTSTWRNSVINNGNFSEVLLYLALMAISYDDRRTRWLHLLDMMDRKHATI